MTLRIISDGTPEGTRIILADTGEDLTKSLRLSEVHFTVRLGEAATARLVVVQPLTDLVVEEVKVLEPPTTASPDGKPAVAHPRLEFFWSARTLRCDAITEEDGLPVIESHDVLSTDSTRSIYGTGNYGELIARLLNEHFAREAGK